MSKSLEGHKHIEPQDEPPVEIRKQVFETNLTQQREKNLTNGPLTTHGVYMGLWIRRSSRCDCFLKGKNILDPWDL